VRLWVSTIVVPVVLSIAVTLDLKRFGVVSPEIDLSPHPQGGASRWVGSKRGRFADMAATKGMAMPKPSEQAKAAFSKLVSDEPAVTLKPMFGQLSAFVNGNMFCGIFGEELTVRLPETEIAAVKKQGGRDFEPMAGHKMSGYVIVPGDWRSKPAPAVALIKKALAHTRAMPAKTAKTKTATKRTATKKR
jgi:TfoX/Sxy family transcriptional regulator of competence genes